MSARGGDACASGSATPDAAPPADTPLARSLQRGHFTQTFGQWEHLGSGGYGMVVKAWHIVEEKWYAVKLIPARVRACETIEDNYEAWSGPEVFRQLKALRSPHVMRYIQYWSELPEDLPAGLDRSPALRPAAAQVRSSRRFKTMTSVASLTGCSTVESDGGFEWASPAAGDSQRPSQSEETTASAVTNSTSSAKAPLHQVVIVEQMEYCEGVTLATWLSQPKLRSGLSEATRQGMLELFAQVMKGLADLHDFGIVHCDVKPSNIMVTMPGSQIKFFDFGSARVRSKAVQRQGSRAPLSPSDQEGSCTALGTPGYAPPEHCMFPAAPPFLRQLSDTSTTQGSDREGHAASSEGRAKVAGPGADIFSAGIVLMEMLMVTIMQGPAWSTAMERAAALAQVRTGRGGALPLAVLRDSGTDGWLRQLVLRMVVWDAEVRPSAWEVLDELDAGFLTAWRHNPNVGMSHPRSPQLAAMSCAPAAAHNPYIGYFLDHRRSGGT